MVKADVTPLSVRILLCVCLSVGGFVVAGSVSAQEGPRNAAKHIGQVMALSANCPNLSSNTTLIALAMMGNNMTPDDIDEGGPYYEEYLDGLAEVILSAENSDWETACAAGRMLYGPGGVNVENLLVEK